MTEKIVTHEDLRHVATVERIMRRNAGEGVSPDSWAEVSKFVERLRAAAEADQPPLPEGWYVYESVDAGTYHVFVRGHEVYERDTSSGTALEVDGDHWGPVSDYAHRLTPLRPTVTEADVEKAARAARAAYYDDPRHWDEVHQDVRDDWMKTTRVALDALGIEVAQP